MAIVENETKIQEKKSKTTKEVILYRIYPDIYHTIDNKNHTVEFEVSLPGIKKEDISLKVLPTWFNLVGRKGQMEYSANKSFGVEIVPEKTKAKYEHGLLKITAYIRDPFENAKEIQL